MYSGIDVSKDWFDAAWQVAGQLRCQQFAYTDEGMEQLMEQVPPTAVFVMEATGTYHARLALKLFEAGRQVSVVNCCICVLGQPRAATQHASNCTNASKLRANRPK